MISAKEIGERLLKLRGERTREEVANAIGVSLSAVSMYENGDRIPRDAIKIKIASFYQKSVQEIFFDSECHI
ncbi:MAG: helix-turn-helix transcriptional regulator [Coprococcus catus]|nr:helix-turn-helix transcriptional regulator [Coprococcus catus]